MVNGGYDISDPGTKLGAKSITVDIQHAKIIDDFAAESKRVNNFDVKGGLVIEQLKRYAKRLSDHIGASAHVSIEIWSNVHGSSEPDFSVGFTVWDSGTINFIKQNLTWQGDDLREIGKLIDDYIANENALKRKAVKNA